MKKKFLSFAAVVLSMAMCSSAFAVTPRQSGDVDGDGVLTAGDAAMILNSAIQQTEIAKGNFDGVWKSVDNKVTASDKDVLMNYILQPENKFDEKINLRIYSTLDSSFKPGVTLNIENGLELNDTKNYDNTYSDLSKELKDTDTVEDVMDDAVALATDATAASVSDNINKVYFTSATKGDVYLTSFEGWATLSYALKSIIPVDRAICDAIGKDYDSLDPKYKEGTADLKAFIRYNMLKTIGENYIYKNGAGNCSLTKADLEDIYDYAKKAIPGNGDITPDMYAEAADDTYAIYSSKYQFIAAALKLNGGTNFNIGQSTDPNFDLLAAALSGYSTLTIQDVRDTFGDMIGVSNGDNTVLAELYAAGINK